jgi:hypothetical protein
MRNGLFLGHIQLDIKTIDLLTFANLKIESGVLKNEELIALFILFRRAFNRAVRAENTTIPFFGPQPYPAMTAPIEKLAGISGYGLFFFKTTIGTLND